MFCCTTVVHHPKQSKDLFWWHRCFDEVPSPQGITYFSILIPGNDAWWSWFNNWSVLQEWPWLQVSVPREGPDGRGLPELQSTVPVWQIWYVPHVWRPDQGKAEIVFWWLSLVQCRNILSQAKTWAGLLTRTQINLQHNLSQEKFLSTNRGNRVVSEKPNKAMANTWQVPSCNTLSFAKALLDEAELVNQCVQRRQVLKVILYFVVIDSSTAVPDLVIRQVMRILWREKKVWKTVVLLEKTVIRLKTT